MRNSLPETGLFRGPGDMRARLRNLDWARSPLGHPSTWCEGLRAIADLILDSNFPMFVIWGAELTSLYNDAYAKILCDKHPAAIGQNFQTVWGEIWPDIEPLVRGAFAGEAFYLENLPLVVERRGYRERAWFTLSYSPVREEDGKVGGAYCAICETTAQVLTEQHQRFLLTLSDRLRRLAAPDDIERLVTERLGQCLHASWVVLAELAQDGANFNIRSAYADDGPAISGYRAVHEFGPVCETCVRTGMPQISLEPSSPIPRAVLEACSTIAVPLVRDGGPEGVLLVGQQTPRIWHASELALAEDVAGRACNSIERARKDAELRLERTFSKDILESLTGGVILVNRDFRVMYINPEGLRLEGRAENEIVGCSLWQAWPDLEALETGRLLRLAMHERRPVSHEHLYHFPTGQEAWLDVHAVPSPDGIVVIYRDITDRKHAQEAIRQAALHDPLTKLPNRSLLFEHATHLFAAARRNKHSVGVMFIDLDRFKPINDLYGHDAGDEVLRQVAARLVKEIRRADIACRLGGDEFLVLVDGLHEPDAVIEIARHMCESLEQPYQYGDQALSLSASIGISLFPRDGEEIETLISHADAAMYQAKQGGQVRYQFYSPELARRSTAVSTIEQQMETALLHDQFRLFYQPVISIHTGGVISVEALLRWPHADIGPERFVPVAEVTGLIGRVGDWVIEEVCRQHHSWEAHGLPMIPIAINVSAVQFRRTDFADHFAQMLHRFKVAPSAVHVELTETALLENIDHAIAALHRFQAMGVKITLDDFGTGYSNLNYLSRLPLDNIKVDKSFVQRIELDLQSRAITEAIIALGHTLHLEIVAEGIESENVLNYLRGHGCDQAQGFHVCAPIAADAFEAWCRERAAPALH